MSAPVKERCLGCALTLPAHGGPAHPYIGASPACWALYGELLAREYGPLNLPEGHRLTVDAYAVQHPGCPERRAIQSVPVHLIGLHLVLERNEAPGRVTVRLGRIIAHLPKPHWLEPPQPNGALTVRHVLAAQADEYAERVREWATAVWRAWHPHHATVQAWLAHAERAG